MKKSYIVLIALIFIVGTGSACFWGYHQFIGYTKEVEKTISSNARDIQDLKSDMESLENLFKNPVALSSPQHPQLDPKLMRCLERLAEDLSLHIKFWEILTKKQQGKPYARDIKTLHESLGINPLDENIIENKKESAPLDKEQDSSTKSNIIQEIPFLFKVRQHRPEKIFAPAQKEGPSPQNEDFSITLNAISQQIEETRKTCTFDLPLSS